MSVATEISFEPWHQPRAVIEPVPLPVESGTVSEAGVLGVPMLGVPDAAVGTAVATPLAASAYSVPPSVMTTLVMAPAAFVVTVALAVALPPDGAQAEARLSCAAAEPRIVVMMRRKKLNCFPRARRWLA